MAQHRIDLLTHDGEPLRTIQQFTRLEYVRVLNDLGWFTLVLPEDYPEALLAPDNLFEIWREPEGAEPQLQMVGFLRKWSWESASDGTELLTLSGPDQLRLLDPATIAYEAGEAEADKTGFADDVIKAIVREARGALAGNDAEGRPKRFPAANFAVDPDVGQGQSIERRFSWRQVLPVIQEIAEASRHQGTPVYFDCVPAGRAQFQFRTWVNVRGADRTLSGGLQPVIFSKEAGNLGDPSLIEDWTQEINYVWGGGQGEGLARVIDTENDLPRMNRSLWNRRDIFQDAREEVTVLGVANRAFERMQAGRPRLFFSGDLRDTPQSRYGVDWGFGDKATARYRNQEFDGIVRTIQITVDDSGREDLRARLEVELATG